MKQVSALSMLSNTASSSSVSSMDCMISGVWDESYKYNLLYLKSGIVKYPHDYSKVNVQKISHLHNSAAMIYGLGKSIHQDLL